MRATRAIRPVTCSAPARRSAGRPPSFVPRRDQTDEALIPGLAPWALRRQFPLVSALMLELAGSSLTARTMRR